MEKTYTFKEFNELLEAKKDTGEYIAKKILKDNRIKKMALFVMASTLNFNTLAYADTTEAAFNKIDQGGMLFLRLAQKLGYWTCIVLCVIEILKCLFNGDNKDIMRIVLKYIIAMSSLYALPWIFDLIVSIFS